MTQRANGKPGLNRKPVRFMDRLQEIGMFFQKRSPQHQSMRRLARRLQKAGIPYAIMGAMAVNAHGGERTTKDIDILLTPEGLERFRQEFVGDAYEPVEGRARRFRERQSGVTVDCLVTGGYPGSGKPGPFAFPDPTEAMLIVSHDRYFLDRVVTKIFELNAGRILAFPGNYQAYARLRQERYEQQLKTWEAQQDYIAKQEEYIRRVHYGQSHKQAQSRRKTLDRLERVERPTLVETPHMHFGEVRRTGDVVLQVDRIAKAYDRPLFSDLSFTLERGRRLGILGPNGSGKTTLLRVLMGEEQPDAGSVQRGHLVEFGYYDQHLKTLAADQPVIRAVWPASDPEVTEQRMRDLLGRFGLMGDQVYQRVGDLSGGERSRAALARLVALGVNVLVLDEPTNHLDLWACDALEQALLEFDGTVIVVSHDRYFLNRVVDQLIVIDKGRAQLIHGNYDTYERMRLLQQDGNSARSGPKEAESKKAGGSTPANATASSKAKRKRRFPYRKVEELEAEIATNETRLRELEALLASPDLYRDGDRVKETMRSFEETKASLKQLYEHWEEAVELN